MESDSPIRKLIENRSEAIGAKDIDRLMSLYALDIAYFDLVPPLRYSGADALRSRFLDWFGRWESAIGQEVRDLAISTSGDIANAHMLIRASGKLKTGGDVDFWVRASDCLQRSDGRWLITHEHISLPVDLETRDAVMDLQP